MQSPAVLVCSCQLLWCADVTLFLWSKFRCGFRCFCQSVADPPCRGFLSLVVCGRVNDGGAASRAEPSWAGLMGCKQGVRAALLEAAGLSLPAVPRRAAPPRPPYYSLLQKTAADKWKELPGRRGRDQLCSDPCPSGGFGGKRGTADMMENGSEDFGDHLTKL